jgi:hypothetical protein
MGVHPVEVRRKESLAEAMKSRRPGCHVKRSTTTVGGSMRTTLKAFTSPLPRVDVAVPAWMIKAAYLAVWKRRGVGPAWLMCK